MSSDRLYVLLKERNSLANAIERVSAEIESEWAKIEAQFRRYRDQKSQGSNENLDIHMDYHQSVIEPSTSRRPSNSRPVPATPPSGVPAPPQAQDPATFSQANRETERAEPTPRTRPSSGNSHDGPVRGVSWNGNLGQSPTQLRDHMTPIADNNGQSRMDGWNRQLHRISRSRADADPNWRLPLRGGATGRKSPVAESVRKSPVAEPARKSPVAESVRKSPVAEPAGKLPVAEPARKFPVAEPARKSQVAEPLGGHLVAAPVSQFSFTAPVFILERSGLGLRCRSRKPPDITDRKNG